MSLDLTQLTMLRLNLWGKPFFHPAAGMENSSYVPTLSTPALMMLASTAEGRDAPRLQVPPHPFSSQSLDKDMPAPPPHFSTAGFVYRPGDHFPSPLYHPSMGPFVRPNLEGRMGLMGPGCAGAFRPLGPHEGVEPYHSAFTPAKKLKIDDVSCTQTSGSSERDGYRDKDGESSRKSLSPSVKEERPSSISSAGGDTNSEIHSDTGDLYDRGTPDSEGRSLRKQRKRSALDGHTPCCPICGLTLRPGEMDTHLALELDKLERICRGGRKSRDSTPQGRKTLPSPSGRKGKDSPSPEYVSQSRYQTYQRIRCNRQARLNARNRNKRRRVGDENSKETQCPICSERLTGTPEELNGHVEICLKKRQHEGEEEPVDVEGDGGEQYEEYTWAGQTRIRATTLLEGGFAGSGFQTASCKKSPEDDSDLNVDVDDSEEYGKPQFSENDLVPLSSYEPMEQRERQALRGALLGHGAERADNHRVGDSTGEATHGCSSYGDTAEDLCTTKSETTASGNQVALLSALKARLKELEQSRPAKQKCLICMEQYRTPLVSIQCWHVHCEECWFRTLGAKKLCPQCNMITSPSDLRRIFL